MSDAITYPVKYKKRPVVIEAMQYDGTNEQAINDTLGAYVQRIEPQNRALLHDPAFKAELWVQANHRWLPIESGEWVAKDSKGCYPIKPDTFAESYEVVSDE